MNLLRPYATRPARTARRILAIRKEPKPSYTEFVQRLAALVSPEPGKDTLPAVLRILRQGYLGEVQPEHAEAVFNLLKDFPSVDRLAATIVSGPAKRRSILWTMRNRLRSWAAEQIDYPPIVCDQDRFYDLAVWIKQGSRHDETVPAANRVRMRAEFTRSTSGRRLSRYQFISTDRHVANFEKQPMRRASSSKHLSTNRSLPWSAMRSEQAILTTSAASIRKTSSFLTGGGNARYHRWLRRGRPCSGISDCGPCRPRGRPIRSSGRKHCSSRVSGSPQDCSRSPGSGATGQGPLSGRVRSWQDSTIE